MELSDQPPSVQQVEPRPALGYRHAMCTFEDLVAGRVPSHKLHEDEQHLAILAPNPVRPGHAIVMTKRAHPYLFDLSEEEHAALWSVARKVARRLKHVLKCERVCVGVIGWQVRHVHVHLVPTDADGQFPPLPGAPADPRELDRLRALLAFET
ncbi:MAG: HIT family protein [Planctomycetes bacterium]|nr:HIT family protein [Planctomycetota bacterium]